MNPREQAEAIFDAFGKFSEVIHRADKERRALEVLQGRSRRECGNCEHWMKSRDCPIDDQRRGFPDHKHPPCGKYAPTRDAAAALLQLTVGDRS